MKGAVRRTEKPAKMSKTGATVTDLPAVAGKPGEFRGRNTACQAAWRFTKTAQLINNSHRIEEGVVVAAVDLYSLVCSGNGCSAAGTENCSGAFLVR
jgi:hypothetical protein